jgi:hypothetical protein
MEGSQQNHTCYMYATDPRLALTPWTFDEGFYPEVREWLRPTDNSNRWDVLPCCCALLLLVTHGCPVFVPHSNSHVRWPERGMLELSVCLPQAIHGMDINETMLATDWDYPMFLIMSPPVCLPQAIPPIVGERAEDWVTLRVNVPPGLCSGEIAKVDIHSCGGCAANPWGHFTHFTHFAHFTPSKLCTVAGIAVCVRPHVHAT